MKVWIVTGQKYDDTWFEGVFSTKNLAKTRIKTLKAKNKMDTYYDCDEYIVDDTRENDA